MYELQYYNGKEWTKVNEWINWEIGWGSLGNDTLNYRMVDVNGRVVKEHKSIPKFKDWTGLSSQIISTSYNEQTKDMTVEFKTGRYRYKDVPLEVWQKSLITESIGKFINTDIKPHYEFKKL